MNFGKNLKIGKKKMKTVHNKNDMSIVGTVGREQQFSATAFMVRRRAGARNTATAYSSERYPIPSYSKPNSFISVLS